MSDSDQFVIEFQELLKGLPPGQTLEELQQTFRKIMFFMGNAVISRFEDAAAGYHPIGPHHAEPILDLVKFSLSFEETPPGASSMA